MRLNKILMMDRMRYKNVKSKQNNKLKIIFLSFQEKTSFII